ncbi:MAG: ferrous iron transport protein A [Myxococcaceae bacterium]|nr:ferrous iron transport protein A [Myxococcaceae bacterium]
MTRDGTTAATVTSLDTLLPGASATVKALHLPPREATWLRAVGLREGTVVAVLRRAPFSGPLHLRLGERSELALARELATHVEVAP